MLKKKQLIAANTIFNAKINEVKIEIRSSFAGVTTNWMVYNGKSIYEWMN